MERILYVGVVGINHKSAPLILQEKVARACQKKLSLEAKLTEELSSVLLSTCNRTEIYFTAEDLAHAHSLLLAALREEIDEPFEHRLYTYFGVDCFAHLATVISGWDSLIVGETEIHRQVKLAYENAKLHYHLKSVLHYVFQKSLKIAKNIRSQLPSHGLSLPEILWDLAVSKLHCLQDKRILLIGNSEMSRKILELLHQKKIRTISLCTRAPLSAGDLKEQYQIAIVDWKELAHFNSYDLIICSTHVSEYLLKYSPDLQRGTQLMIDLSVPRAIDPQFSKLPGLRLWNMEQIGEWIHQGEFENASVMEQIWMQVERYTQLFAKKWVGGRV